MGKFFAGSEIVEMGIRIEKNGRDFYLAVGDRNRKSRELFRYLAKEEEKHIAVFQGLLAKVEKYEPPETYPGEYFAYLSALADDYVFTRKNQGAVMAAKVKNETGAVNLGIGFEKDSILFYLEMKRLVPEYDRRTVEALISQEREHLRRLVELKKKLKK